MRQVNHLHLGARATLLAIVLLLPLALLRAQDIQWARQFGTNRFDQANGVAAVDGNVYVVGDVIGALPGLTSEGLNDRNAFVRRYDAAGSVSWTRQFGSTAALEDTATSVAADAGGVYVAGWTRGVLPQQNKSGSYDAFVRKYDLNGNEQWTRQFGTLSSVQAFGVAVDATGVYVAGFVDCCGSPFPGIVSTPGADAFLRKYDPNGVELWTRQFGSPDVDRATGVAVDATGVYVTGTTNGTLAGPRGGLDGFLRKYDTDGRVVWTKQFGTLNASEESNVVAVSPSGIYVGGRTTGSFQGQQANGLWDAYVIQFDAEGTIQWARQFGGKDGDNVLGLAAGVTHLLVTGAADGALPGQTFVGGQDAFFRLYDFAGGELSTREFGNGLNDFGAGAAADARGFYIAGSKNGAALGLAPVGDNDAFVMKVAPPPLVPVAPRPGPAPRER